MMQHGFARKALFCAALLYATTFTWSAFADPLTLTTLRAPESQDPSSGVGQIMRDVWAEQIEDVGDRAYNFGYALFKAGDQEYLVSSFRSAECRPDECTWQVQRLTSSYRVAASGNPFTACGALNEVEVKDGRLTICATEVDLP